MGDDITGKSVFSTTFGERKKSIETLIDESRADADFYIFLTGAALITALGLLIDNSVVVIGGMLVAPLLYPILSLGMGVVTSSRGAIARSLWTIIKSMGIVFFISLVTAFLLNGKEVTRVTELASRPELISFIVAFASGILGAYAWVKQEASSLPGIAIAVSLIPPLSAVGIGVSLLSKDVIAGAITLFLLNLFGIVMASMVIFSLFGFSRLQQVQEDKIEEEKAEKELEKKIKKGHDMDNADQTIVIKMSDEGVGK